MKAKDLCTRYVVTARVSETIVEAAQRMTEAGIGDLVVVDGANHPIGIITDRDLVTRGLARGAPLASTLGDVMDCTLVTCSEDTEVEEILATLRRQAVRRLPVLDRKGCLLGIVTLDDIVVWISERMEDVVALLARQSSDSDS
jgi:CBS domain-containing protein